MDELIFRKLSNFFCNFLNFCFFLFVCSCPSKKKLPKKTKNESPIPTTNRARVPAQVCYPFACSGTHFSLFRCRPDAVYELLFNHDPPALRRRIAVDQKHELDKPSTLRFTASWRYENGSNTLAPPTRGYRWSLPHPARPLQNFFFWRRIKFDVRLLWLLQMTISDWIDFFCDGFVELCWHVTVLIFFEVIQRPEREVKMYSSVSLLILGLLCYVFGEHPLPDAKCSLESVQNANSRQLSSILEELLNCTKFR